jgi:hypothetical protein
MYAPWPVTRPGPTVRPHWPKPARQGAAGHQAPTRHLGLQPPAVPVELAKPPGQPACILNPESRRHSRTANDVRPASLHEISRLARAITTTAMTKPPTRAASMNPRRRTPADGCGLCGRSSMGISSPRVGPDGRELAKHLQPAMMILWTNEPLIKREMTQQGGTGRGPAHSPNCFDARRGVK